MWKFAELHSTDKGTCRHCEVLKPVLRAGTQAYISKAEIWAPIPVHHPKPYQSKPVVRDISHIQWDSRVPGLDERAKKFLEIAPQLEKEDIKQKETRDLAVINVSG